VGFSFQSRPFIAILSDVAFRDLNLNSNDLQDFLCRPLLDLIAFKTFNDATTMN